MGSTLVKTKNTETINRCIKKFGKVQVSNVTLEGHLVISRYRQYTYYTEADVTFFGKIYCKIGTNRKWYTKDELFSAAKNISKIRLNRLIRKYIIKDLREHLTYFGVEIKHYSQIKKINWN